MIAILYLFALVTRPTDRYICDLWTRSLALNEVREACGVLHTGYRLDVYDLDMMPVCSRPADLLYEISSECALEETLDHYVLRVVEPGYSTLLCFVETPNRAGPNADEISAQCPGAREYEVRFAGVKPPPPEEKPFTCPPRILEPGPGLYARVETAEALYTDEPLTWLAGMLIWHGLIRAECYGSGLDPFTLAADACGMAHARPEVIRWQNQFNAAIFEASAAYNVPPRLIKRMIAVESQYWPFYTAPAGEIGIFQVTDNGLDVLHRFDPAIDPTYFERDDIERAWSRNVTRNRLVCVECSVQEALDHIRITMPYYARLVAAYHCRAVVINPSLLGVEAWRQAVVDYNGSAAYLERIEK